MVEIEIGVLRGQCLDRRIATPERLASEIAAWERQRNATRAQVFVDWGGLLQTGYFPSSAPSFVLSSAEGSSRKPYPSVVIVDSQTVRSGKMGGIRGYDGGKHIKGRKRHAAVDTLGLPMAVKLEIAAIALDGDINESASGRSIK